MIEPEDFDRALTIPCPNTSCSAFCGEECISYVSGRRIGVPHRERLQAVRDATTAEGEAASR